MGNSTSTSSPTSGYGDYNYSNDVEYSVGVIDDRSINQVIRDQQKYLSYQDKQLLRDAQFRASSEWSRTMKNCELYIYLDGFDVVLRSGDCSNKVIVRRNGSGEIEWRYVRRSKSQHAYDVGRDISGFLSRGGSYFAGVVGRIAGAAVKSIGWR